MRLYRHRVLEFFGGLEETAAAMGLSAQAVRIWQPKLSRKLSAQAIGFAVLERGVGATRSSFPEWFKEEQATDTEAA